MGQPDAHKSGRWRRRRDREDAAAGPQSLPTKRPPEALPRRSGQPGWALRPGLRGWGGPGRGPFRNPDTAASWGLWTEPGSSSALDILGSRGGHFQQWECMLRGPDPFLSSHGSTPGGGQGGTSGARGGIGTEPLSPASVWTFSPLPGFEECLSQFAGYFRRTFFHR